LQTGIVLTRIFAMLPTILISLFIGFAAAIALGVCIIAIHAGIRRGREIRHELKQINRIAANKPYIPAQSRGLWAVSPSISLKG